MPIPSLRELQGLFWRSIAGAPGTIEPAAALLAVTEPSASLDPAARLSVYVDAYLWRLRDVLAEDFPRVATILGPDRFDVLARDYLRDHPSEHPSLRHLGRDLPAEIGRRPDSPPYLADLARLEWARLEVFDAADSEALTADALRALRPEHWPTLRFVPVPALAILRADWPVHEVWQATDAASPEPSRTFLRVWRAEDGRVFHASMDERDVDALERMMAAEPFATICAAFDDLPPAEAGQQATALLARWLEDGIIARVVRPDC